jgi:hypothetical protein
METDGERFSTGRFVQPDIADDLALKILDDDLVAKTAVAVRLAHRAAEKLHFEAMLLLSDLTEAAMAAGQAGAKCDTVARLDVGDLAADGFHRAGHFVTEDDGFADLDRPDAAIPEIMDIRPTEAIHKTASELEVDPRGARDTELLYRNAAALSFCGQSAAALRQLRKAITGNYCSYPALNTDPMFDPIRQRTEFAGLVQAAIQCQENFKVHRDSSATASPLSAGRN